MTTILITGAGRGIGFELAKQSIKRGWNVIGSVRSVEAQRKLASALPEMAVLNFDVTDSSAIEKIVNAFHHPIDVLINNAGIIGPERQSTLDMDFDGFEETLKTNVLAPLKIAQCFLPLLQASKHARLVNISSQMGRMAHVGSDRIAYRASKAALNKVTQGLADDLRTDGICCVVMHPGWVQSDMGGVEADITMQESAFGILNVTSQLTMEDSGTFIDYDGTRPAW